MNMRRARARSLWSYSKAFDLRHFDPKTWVSGEKSCWDVAEALDETQHYQLINTAQAKNLREMDALEARADALREHESRKQNRSIGKRNERKNYLD